MFEKEYKIWLRSSVKDPSDYLSQIRTVEEHYGDIDLHYAGDGCAWLLTEFEYTSADKNNEREKRHRIPIISNPGGDKFESYYNGTKSYQSKIKKYIKFRESTQTGHQRPAIPNETRLEIPSHIAPVPRGSRKNARYDGYPIGNAQNSVVRTVLSNLGDESFNAKDWKETKAYFGNKCAYCGASDKDLIQDHVIPINKDDLGEHKLGNIVPSCRSCNSKKSNQDYRKFCKGDSLARIEKYMESRGYIPLTASEQKSEDIRTILSKAHEEVRIVADKYIELINELFFSEDTRK